MRLEGRWEQTGLLPITIRDLLRTTFAASAPSLLFGARHSREGVRQS